MHWWAHYNVVPSAMRMSECVRVLCLALLFEDQFVFYPLRVKSFWKVRTLWKIKIYIYIMSTQGGLNKERTVHNECNVNNVSNIERWSLESKLWPHHSPQQRNKSDGVRVEILGNEDSFRELRFGRWQIWRVGVGVVFLLRWAWTAWLVGWIYSYQLE